jgi:radical SAM superfamily enzyme YgiQ (UPF0313 family)
MEHGTVSIRPPSEAESFLLPITYGCSHNKCTFCYYNLAQGPFRTRKFEDIKRDVDALIPSSRWSVRRIFLQDGDALACSQPRLVDVLDYLGEKFPNLHRVGIYGTPQDVLRKSVDELRQLRDLKLGIVYMGVETGDEELLRKVCKGVDYAQMVEAGRRVMEAGIRLSVTVILGLGGVAGSEEHALATAKILTDIDPDYVGALTLMLYPGSPLHDELDRGDFIMVDPFQSLQELRTIVADSTFTECFLASNHASNYLPIKGRMPRDKKRVLKLIDDVLAEQDPTRLRPEWYRAL